MQSITNTKFLFSNSSTLKLFCVLSLSQFTGVTDTKYWRSWNRPTFLDLYTFPHYPYLCLSHSNNPSVLGHLFSMAFRDSLILLLGSGPNCSYLHSHAAPSSAVKKDWAFRQWQSLIFPGPWVPCAHDYKLCIALFFGGT